MKFSQGDRVVRDNSPVVGLVSLVHNGEVFCKFPEETRDYPEADAPKKLLPAPPPKNKLEQLVPGDRFLMWDPVAFEPRELMVTELFEGGERRSRVCVDIDDGAAFPIQPGFEVDKFECEGD
jgi:hypothetical protein